MKKLLFILLLTIPFVGFGQGWEKTYIDYIVDDKGYFVNEVNDGYIVLGERYNTGMINGGVVIIKTNFFGDTLWTETTNNPIYNLIDCEVTDDSGFIVIGRSLGGSGNYVLLKLNNIGQEQWSHIYDWGFVNNIVPINEVIQTTDGGYIIVGTGSNFYSLGGSSVMRYNIRVIKTNSVGDTLWTKQYHLNNKDEFGTSIRETDDGGFIISGGVINQDLLGVNQQDIYLLKIDINGDQQWNKTYGGLDDDYCSQVRQTTDGGYIITGRTFSFGNGGDDVYLIKTNSIGDTLWTNTFGGNGFEDGNDIEQTSDGGYIVTGKTTSFGSGSYDVYLIKTDGNGIEQWSQTYGSTGTDNSNDVEQTSDGGYIICGYYTHDVQFNNDQDIYLIKTDGSGNVTSTFNIPPPSSNRELIKVVDVLGRETKPQLNTPIIEIYDDGSTEKKIVIE